MFRLTTNFGFFLDPLLSFARFPVPTCEHAQRTLCHVPVRFFFNHLQMLSANQVDRDTSSSREVMTAFVWMPYDKDCIDVAP